ncbi:MAG: glycosyltransferase [Bacteroidales bacterium]|jgi:glycosyltransferase involved in cell wall biosynthesis|nr:glycosyltransferase [Bacteroidales bacterium]
MIEIKYISIELCLTYALLAFIGIQLFYYVFFYMRLLFIKRNQPAANNSVPISVIICAKNQEENLQQFLPAVLEQNYKTYEVIVVNDCSSDNTEFLLQRLQTQYPHLRYTFIKEDQHFKHGKKLAVTVGIKAARYNHFAFIDADCYPESKEWLQGLSNQFCSGIQLVLGYGGYEAQEGMLDKLVRYDTLQVAMNYLSFAHTGIPYMGVGRNMAYTREAYMKSSRFSNHYHILSGDDDLFVSEVGRKHNTAIEIAPETITRSLQVDNFKQWCAQKRRHLTSSKKYRLIHKILLALEAFSREMFYMLTLLYVALSIFMGPAHLFECVIGAIVVRFAVQHAVVMSVAKRLNEKGLAPYIVLFDIYLPLASAWFFVHNKLHPDRAIRW